MARFKPSDGDLARLTNVKFATVRGIQCECDLRVLSFADDEAVIDRALAYCRERGNAATIDNPAYDAAVARERIALCAVDPDSPKHKPEPYFPNGVADVRDELDRDTVVYLSKLQEAFQSKMSPLKRQFDSMDEYWDAVRRVAAVEDGDKDPFDAWAPSMRLNFERSMAAQLLTCLMSNSVDSSLSTSPLGMKPPQSPH